MRILAAALATLALLAPQAHAQHAWSASEVAQQCTIEGAFGQSFGERRANGRTGRVNHPFAVSDRTVRPPAAYPPFDAFELKFTPRTRLIAQVTAMATFESDAEAEAAYDLLISVYEVSDRFPFQNEDAILRPDGPEGTTFKTEESEALLSATVAREGRTLYLVCAHGPLTTQGFQEAFEQFDNRR